MTATSLIFTNSELPKQLLIEVDGEIISYPDHEFLEEEYDRAWDRCFVNNVSILPKHRYWYPILRYSQSEKKHNLDWYKGILEELRKEIAFLKKVILNYKEKPLYVLLDINHIITEDDLENIVEIDLNDLDFTEGNEPDDFMLEINKFYRFVMR